MAPSIDMTAISGSCEIAANSNSTCSIFSSHDSLDQAEIDNLSMPPPAAPPLPETTEATIATTTNLTTGVTIMSNSKKIAASAFIPISEETVFLEPEQNSPASLPNSITAMGTDEQLQQPQQRRHHTQLHHYNHQLTTTVSSSPHSGDSWMNYSSNSSDDFSGLSEQMKAVGSGVQTGDNSSDDASSDYESNIISQTEIMMMRRYKTQPPENGGESAVTIFSRMNTGGSNSNSSNSSSAISSSNSSNSGGSGCSGCVSTFPVTISSLTTSTSSSSLRSLKSAVKRLRFRLDETLNNEDVFSKTTAIIKQSCRMSLGTQKENFTTKPIANTRNYFMSGAISNSEEKDIEPVTSKTSSNVSNDVKLDQKKGQYEKGNESNVKGDIERLPLYDNEEEDLNCPVDVRLIDFAHTAFMPGTDRIILLPSNQIKVHHGPDNGFLTGLDSLNRLLNEILDEELSTITLTI